MGTTMRTKRLGWVVLLGTAGVMGCSGADGGTSLFPHGSADGSTGGGSDASNSTGGDDGGANGGDGTTSGDGDILHVVTTCNQGLACAQVQCDGGVTTTVSGIVYDPAGKVPLYNVVVYVPNAPVQPFSSNGATCDKCGGTVSGSPLVITLTNAKGEFVLNDVPAGTMIPLVMQIGKWRRQVKIPMVAPCIENQLTDHDLTRLPRNQGEGDIPRIALTTGGADPLECLPRKIGLDDAEFTTAGGMGRVHLYAGGGWIEPSADGGMTTHDASAGFAPKLNGGMAFADATNFWSSASELQKYDILLMACEGTLNKPTKPASALAALYDFENAGGRVFASHWHRYWFSDGPAPVPSVGTWTDRIDPAATGTTAIGTVNTGFPKGMALRDWLVNVGASTTPGELPIKDSKHNLDAVNSAEAQDWISMPNPKAGNQTAVQYMTFNTPIGKPDTALCGRVVFSDLHVSSGDQPGQPFPSGCVTTDLSPQEKALEFMLFDLSSCVSSDSVPPTPPPR